MKLELISKNRDGLCIFKDEQGRLIDAFEVKEGRWRFPFGEPDGITTDVINKAIKDWEYRKRLEDKLIKEGLNADQIVTAIRI
jgi:hypothetical protein